MNDDKKVNVINSEEEGDAGSGTRTGDGRIAFKDFLGEGDSSREALPEAEIKRLLSVHKDTNELHIKMQKETKENYQTLRSGKITLAAHRAGLGAGAGSGAEYKPNPVLIDKAQFAGTDNKVNALPTENNANTNEGDKHELDNEYRLNFTPDNVPRFNPKPQFNR